MPRLSLILAGSLLGVYLPMLHLIAVQPRPLPIAPKTSQEVEPPQPENFDPALLIKVLPIAMGETPNNCSHKNRLCMKFFQHQGLDV